MCEISINGNLVTIGVETMRRISKVAAEKKIAIPDAISFCLERSYDLKRGTSAAKGRRAAV